MSEVALDVLQTIEKVARVVEHRRAGGTDWKITLEANGERVAIIERNVRGLSVLFTEPLTPEEQASIQIPRPRPRSAVA